MRYCKLFVNNCNLNCNFHWNLEIIIGSVFMSSNKFYWATHVHHIVSTVIVIYFFCFANFWVNKVKWRDKCPSHWWTSSTLTPEFRVPPPTFEWFNHYYYGTTTTSTRLVTGYYAALPMRSHYALHPAVCCLSIPPVLTINSKMENHTTIRLSGEITNVKSKWQSTFKVTRSRSLGQKCIKSFLIHMFAKNA